MNESVLENGNASRPHQRNDREPGSMLWEAAAAGLALIALYVTCALVFGSEGRQYIGELGVTVAKTLNWLFGNIVAYAVPGFLLLFAIQLFIGKKAGWSWERIVGIAVVIPAISGALALPYADDSAYSTTLFQRGGVTGSFLVEYWGLGIYAACGMVGTGLILMGMLLGGSVLITGLPISTIALLVTKPFTRGKKEEAKATAPLPAIEKPTASKSTAQVLPIHDQDGDEEDLDEAPPVGFFGKLFGRRKSPALAEPDPEESRDVELPDLYDEDSLAALQALEEARIDEEYERALREEADAESRMMPSLEEEFISKPDPIEDELAEEMREEESIIFNGGSAEEIETVSGNPKNEESSVPLGEELAKMFPSRWDSENGEVQRIDKNAKNKRDKPEEEIMDAAEGRAFRRTGKQMEIDRAEEDWASVDDVSFGEGEDDPLFDPNLETRPHGVEAAQEEARISAMERDTALAKRSRMLAAYQLPEIELLSLPPKIDHQMPKEEMLEISQTLEKTFADFNIEVKVVEVTQGPVVTRFEVKPAPGIKVSRIVGLEHDIAMAMRAVSVRIVAPIPGKAAIGIEVPNRNRQGVYFRELASCKEFWDHPSPLAFALGKTIEGKPYFADLKKMPHLLIAGATGAGKSVCLNTIICSLLYRQRPDRMRLLMVDPKRVELSIYQDIPHLISPVVCDAKSAAAALAWAVEQMEERYKMLVELNVRNIDGYNEVVTNPEKQGKLRGKTLEPMPHMVIIVDELADLMVVAKNEVEESIQRLAQMARAVGIHLILATQRPSVNVITGIIKANFPTRIAFQVSQKVDSRTILDGNGAEHLLGRGDMLYAPAGAGKPLRVQGAFLSDEEVERIADHTRDQFPPNYDVEEFEPILSEKEQRELAKMMGGVTNMDDLDMQDRMARGTNKTMGKVSAGMFVPHEGGSANADDDNIDEALVRAAARVILEGRKGSTSLVQRRLKVGFARAGRLMDMLEEMGIVGPYKGSKPRDLMVDPDAAIDQLDALEEQIDRSGSSKAAADALDNT